MTRIENFSLLREMGMEKFSPAMENRDGDRENSKDVGQVVGDYSLPSSHLIGIPSWLVVENV